jgi:hypothetical protein
VLGGGSEWFSCRAARVRIARAAGRGCVEVLAAGRNAADLSRAGASHRCRGGVAGRRRLPAGGGPNRGSCGRLCLRHTRGLCWRVMAFAATFLSHSWSAPLRPASLQPTSCSIYSQPSALYIWCGGIYGVAGYMVWRAMISGLFLCAHVTGSCLWSIASCPQKIRRISAALLVANGCSRRGSGNSGSVAVVSRVRPGSQRTVMVRASWPCSVVPHVGSVQINTNAEPKASPA